MIKCLNILLLVILFVSCKRNPTIADSMDYTAYMDTDASGIIQQANEELTFWKQRLDADTGNYVDMMKLAAVHLRLFKLTAQVTHLRMADSLMKRSTARLRNSDPDILYALAQHSIMQHEFRNAAGYAGLAANAGGDRFILTLIQFDASMELGDYLNAGRKLESIKDKSLFDYLIRKSKFEDHRGNLDAAIILMEKAFEKVKNSKVSLYCWTLASLGDMYGHAGRIKDSYNAYLGVLSKDSHYYHALKGIAWIVYSHDRNPGEAKRIIRYIQSRTPVPDLWLDLSELAAFENDNDDREAFNHQFLRQVQQPGYGEMYNQYLVRLYADELKEPGSAVEIAGKEIKNRPTPETYDGLAWALFKKGEKEKAFIISRNNVWKRSYEPVILYHTAIIFNAAGWKKEARSLFESCLESSFELGPLISKEVEQALAAL